MRSQWAPLVVGILAICTLALYLASEDPAPGTLAAAHASLPDLSRLEGCETCHAPEGLTQGCLGCHDEIGTQLESRSGFHRDKPECAGCHPDHNGEDFDLMEAVAWKGDARDHFDHRHVDYGLEGRHDELECQACHEREFALADFPGHPRRKSYLGLAQECLGCHEDIHDGGDFHACERCHDQERFKPASLFDHSRFYPLLGGHEGQACGGCHVLPDDEGLPYHKVRGKACRDCHQSPHRTEWKQDCESCHAKGAPPWNDGATKLTPDLHAATGFALRVPHEKVACEGCHEPGLAYDERFAPEPRLARDCRACHEDVHRGQFGERDCLECHAEQRFKPAIYGLERHTTFALEGAHRRADCAGCHAVEPETGVRRFAGTPRTCAACHEDRHEGQFKEQSCSACHDQERFLPARYDIGSHTTFALTGAHLAVTCRSCHTVEPPATTRRFVGAPQRCRECHADPHGGQFAERTRRNDCTACHRPDAGTFAIRPFDHAKRARYPLAGAHAEADCAACHRPDRKGVHRYRQTPTRCADCHTDVHRGQFRRDGTVSCERCHPVGHEWTLSPDFDHDTRTRYVLDASHAKVDCSGCHVPVPQPDGTRVVQYRPLGMECRDCHEIDRR